MVKGIRLGGSFKGGNVVCWVLFLWDLMGVGDSEVIDYE